MTAPTNLQAVSGLASPAEQQLLPGLLEKLVSKEMLDSLIAKLKDGGLGAEVKSWLDKAKQNIPITAEQVRTALGEERLKQIADTLGVSPETLANIIAYVLPSAASGQPPTEQAPAPAPGQPAPSGQPAPTQPAPSQSAPAQPTPEPAAPSSPGEPLPSPR